MPKRWGAAYDVDPAARAIGESDLPHDFADQLRAAARSGRLVDLGLVKVTPARRSGRMG